MGDDRFVEERCAATFITDQLHRRLHRCVFHVGHSGLHFSDRWWGPHGEDWQTEAFWWGTDTMLAQELLNPVHQPQRAGDQGGQQ